MKESSGCLYSLPASKCCATAFPLSAALPTPSPPLTCECACKALDLALPGNASLVAPLIISSSNIKRILSSQDTLRFWNADDRKKNHRHTAGPERQIGAIGDISQHYRRDFSYDKVEEPLRRNIGRVLGAQDEGDGTTTEGVENNPEFSRLGFKFGVKSGSRTI